MNRTVEGLKIECTATKLSFTGVARLHIRGEDLILDYEQKDGSGAEIRVVGGAKIATQPSAGRAYDGS